MPTKEKSGIEARASIVVAVVGAIGVLGAALFSNWKDITHRSHDEQKVEQSQSEQTESGNPAPASTHGLSAKADDVIYTIESGHRDSYSETEYQLQLRVKMSCHNQRGENFEARVFRLVVDGDKLQPEYGGDNYFIQSNSDKTEQIKFIYSKKSQSLKLQVGPSDTSRIAEIPLSVDQLAQWDRTGQT